MHRLPPEWQKEMDQIMHVLYKDISLKDLGEFIHRLRHKNAPIFLKIQRPIRQQAILRRVWAEKQKIWKVCLFLNPMKGTSSTATSTRNVMCLFCRQELYLNQCKKFKKLSCKVWLDFVNQHKLCTACLKEGHLARTCNKRRDMSLAGNKVVKKILQNVATSTWRTLNWVQDLKIHEMTIVSASQSCASPNCQEQTSENENELLYI